MSGNTESVAGYIAAATGLTEQDIGDVDGATVAGYDALIVGAPTWHTGADTERSGTSWDEFLYGDLTSLDLKGKKVAIFGVGDRKRTNARMICLRVLSLPPANRLRWLSRRVLSV